MQIRCALVRSERSIPMLTVFVYDYKVIHLHHRLPTFTFERGVPNNTTSECQISVLCCSKSYYHCLHSWTWRKGGPVIHHGVCGRSRVSRRALDHLCWSMKAVCHEIRYKSSNDPLHCSTTESSAAFSLRTVVFFSVDLYTPTLVTSIALSRDEVFCHPWDGSLGPSRSSNNRDSDPV